MGKYTNGPCSWECIPSIYSRHNVDRVGLELKFWYGDKNTLITNLIVLYKCKWVSICQVNNSFTFWLRKIETIQS